MSQASRKLKVGAKVYTDFSGKITHHEITERLAPCSSQSKAMYKVAPIVPKSSGDWLDADWFEVASPTLNTEKQ